MSQAKGYKGVVLSFKNLLFGVVCSIIILCFAVSLTVLFRPLYYFDIELLSIPENSGISAEVCKENYDVLIDYNLLLSGEKSLEFPDFVMSEEGRIHFEEVKRIFLAAQVISVIGIIFFSILLFRLMKKKNINLDWMRAAACICTVLVAVVGLSVAINWEWSFQIMHSIFFKNDFWIFDYRTDPIITILPDEFFMHCGILIFALIIIFVIACEIIYRSYSAGKFRR